jgi:serine/threonine protein kinase
LHRDVKPENLFVTDAGGEQDFVKVLDFGIVRRQNDDAKNLTQTGAIAGTPAYIAPEVIRGDTITAAADVYALGAVLYFLLTGRPPFEGQTAVALLLAHLNEPVQSPSVVLGKPIAPDVEKLVLRCLSKTPAERPADGRALAEELAATSVAGRWSSRHAASLKAPRATTEVAFAATQENLLVSSRNLPSPGVARDHDPRGEISLAVSPQITCDEVVQANDTGMNARTGFDHLSTAPHKFVTTSPVPTTSCGVDLPRRGPATSSSDRLAGRVRDSAIWLRIDAERY